MAIESRDRGGPGWARGVSLTDLRWVFICGSTAVEGKVGERARVNSEAVVASGYRMSDVAGGDVPRKEHDQHFPLSVFVDLAHR